MARIQNSNVRENSRAYERLFGIDELGALMSRVHSAVISSGTELERMVLARVEKIENLDEFLKMEIMPDGVFVAPKKQIKKSVSLEFPEAEPDFLIFKRRQGQQNCHVVELKDGHVFDTKKARAERRAIHAFIEQNAHRIQYRVSCHFCCFNQPDRNAIVAGFKRKITKDEAMTGREFCDLLEIDYDEIVRSRQDEQPANVEFFLQELAKIDEVRRRLEILLRED